MSKYVLVKFCADYADEFNVFGFDVMERSQWEILVGHAKVLFDKPKPEGTDSISSWHWERMNAEEFYFGTNEAISFCSYADFERAYKVFDITEEEVAMLQKFFPGYEWELNKGLPSFGNTLIEGIYERATDTDDYEDEDDDDNSEL